MDHDPWLIKEVRRLTSDLRNLRKDLELAPARFRIGFTDADEVVVLGKGEWRVMVERIEDAHLEIIQQLNDFIDNEHGRQLHWSALRMLTASGVLSTELKAFHRRLAFIAENPGAQSTHARQLEGWFEAQLLPACARLSSRLLQMVSRVLDPHAWQLTSEINTASPNGEATTSLAMTFHPNTDERVNKQREKERRLAVLRVD